jgi:hypothetical protein
MPRVKIPEPIQAGRYGVLAHCKPITPRAVIRQYASALHTLFAGIHDYGGRLPVIVVHNAVHLGENLLRHFLQVAGDLGMRRATVGSGGCTVFRA